MDIAGFTPAFALAFVSSLVGAGVVWGALRTRVDAVEKDAGEALAKATAAQAALSDFKLKAAETYVSAAALVRLEGRLDEGFKVLRDEMRDQQATIVNALMSRPGARRKSEGLSE